MFKIDIGISEKSYYEMVSNMDNCPFERIKNQNSIVMVTAKNGEQFTSGSGFFYGWHDFLITAGHLAAFASPAAVSTLGARTRVHASICF